MVDGNRSFGHDRWTAKDGIRHERADSNGIRLECHRSERSPAVKPWERGGAGVTVVVGDEEEVESKLLDPSPTLDERRELGIRNVENSESKLGHGSVFQFRTPPTAIRLNRRGDR